jgi:uncharacterized membrane protein YoaT (DUF817 family)
MKTKSRTIHRFAAEFFVFGMKKASACIFAGTLLATILLTHYWYPFTSLHRYDFLFLFALGVQLLLLATRLESKREALVIVVFHALATGMEIFKTSDAIQSWRYPGEFVLGIGNVPLFAGFMYSAVGSYIARVWRLFDFRFSHYPPVWVTALVAGVTYLNFFSHHFILDLRWGLFAAVGLLYFRSWIYFRIMAVHRRMPLLLGCLLVAIFIWIAENAATFGSIWLYPNQFQGWNLVPLNKLGSWFLLLILSFVLVSLVHRPQPPNEIDEEDQKCRD